MSIDWRAILVSLKLATTATGVVFVIGLPLAYWLARTRWRGRFAVDAVVSLPLVLPPTVLGFYLLLLLGPQGIVGGTAHALTGRRLPFTFTAILIGTVVANLPIALRSFVAAFARIDQRLIEASWCLGISRWETYRRVVLPLAWPGILSGLVLTFAHSLGEFGVVLMLGGNVPGVTRTISVAIYDDVQALEYGAAANASAVLLAFSFSVLCLTHVLERRGLPR